MDSKGKERGKGKDSVERHDASQSPDSQEALSRLPLGSQPAQDGVACREGWGSQDHWKPHSL